MSSFAQYSGHMYFKRCFFPRADKEAIIVDEQFKAGASALPGESEVTDSIENHPSWLGFSL